MINPTLSIREVGFFCYKRLHIRGAY